MRVKRQESLADVSGAVEIDPETLSAIEQGTERPGEEILLLLISYFAAKDDVATKLWRLAGYDQDELPIKTASNAADQLVNGIQQTGGPIVYTDMVHVVVNNYGVVMEFMQNATGNSSPQAVARVGMSKEHAKSVVELLQKSLSTQKTKQLRLPKSRTKKDAK